MAAYAIEETPDLPDKAVRVIKQREDNICGIH